MEKKNAVGVEEEVVFDVAVAAVVVVDVVVVVVDKTPPFLIHRLVRQKTDNEDEIRKNKNKITKMKLEKTR